MLIRSTLPTDIFGTVRRHVSSSPLWMLGAASLLLALGLWRLPAVAHRILYRWHEARGYEAEWIAEKLATGHGFAFGGAWGWLGPYQGIENSPSAWSEPLQSFIMAGSFYLFDEYGRLLLVLLNVFWISCTAFLIVLCFGRDRFREGILAALCFLLFLVYVTKPWLKIGNGALASFLFALIALLFFRALDHPSFRRTLSLGAAIGVANLAHAGSLLFGVIIGALLLFRSGIPRRTAWSHAVIVVVLPLAMISPWTLRNYVTFREFVPIRTGFGWQLYMGNPALNLTLPDQRSPAPEIAPPWTASSAREAVHLLRQIPNENERALRGHAMDVARTEMPAEYQSFNEAQRDAYFASLATRWIRDHPLAASRFALAKGHAFFFGWGWQVTLVTLLAVLGFLFHWRDPRILGLAVLIAAYAVPYVLTMPFFYRYRMPIEPFLFILIGWLLVRVHASAERTDRLPSGAVRAFTVVDHQADRAKDVATRIQ